MRGRLRWVTAAAIGSCVVASTVASAATLGGAAASSLGAAAAPLSGCDSDGFTVSYTVQSGSVTAVTIGDIADPACEGGELRVTVTDAGVAVGSGGPVVVPSDPDSTAASVTVSIDPQPSATVVDDVRVSLAT